MKVKRRCQCLKLYQDSRYILLSFCCYITHYACSNYSIHICNKIFPPWQYRILTIVCMCCGHVVYTLQLPLLIYYLVFTQKRCFIILNYIYFYFCLCHIYIYIYMYIILIIVICVLINLVLI